MVAADVIEQQQRPTWSQHPVHLRDRRSLVGKTAEPQGAHHRVEQGIGKRERLCVGFPQRARGLTFAIIEAADSVGHAWRSRWDSLGLFTPAQHASLPGLAFPAAPDTYPTKDQVADYLRSYAETMNVDVT